jgi:hypothetical protein
MIPSVHPLRADDRPPDKEALKMPSTLAIDARNTFARAILMAIGPKLDYSTGAQSTSAANVPKWEAQVAVTYLAENGRRPDSEVINVTLTQPTDPADQVKEGPVEFDGLRVGWTAPEVRDGRARGGRPWYQAAGIRPALNGHRKTDGS